MPGFKGKRKGGLTLTLYKKPFRYRLPVSPPRKRTKTSSSTPNLKSPSIRTPSLLKKSLSISKYLYPFKRVSSSLAKGYDPLYSSSSLASLDAFSRSHGDDLYVMQLVVAATNQNALYKKHMFCRKNVNKIKMRVHIK